MNIFAIRHFTRYAEKNLLPKHLNMRMQLIPDALLFYNDYNETNPVKREKIYKMVKGLKDAGVPIHGVGLQAHWSIHDLQKDR